MSLNLELKKQLMGLSSREDIDEAWAILRRAAAHVSQAATLNFHIGQKVMWDSVRLGDKMRGTIEKINQRTVTVKIPGGSRWRVSADMLQADNGKEKA